MTTESYLMHIHESVVVYLNTHFFTFGAFNIYSPL